MPLVVASSALDESWVGSAAEYARTTSYFCQSCMSSVANPIARTHVRARDTTIMMRPLVTAKRPPGLATTAMMARGVWSVAGSSMDACPEEPRRQGALYRERDLLEVEGDLWNCCWTEGKKTFRSYHQPHETAKGAASDEKRLRFCVRSRVPRHATPRQHCPRRRCLWPSEEWAA